MASNPIALRPSPPAQHSNYPLPSMVAPARSRPREAPGIHRLKATGTIVTRSNHRLRGSHRGICNVFHPTILRRGSTPPPPPKPASKLLAPMWPGGESHRPPSPDLPTSRLGTFAPKRGTQPYGQMFAKPSPTFLVFICFGLPMTPDFLFGN